MQLPRVPSSRCIMRFLCIGFSPFYHVQCVFACWKTNKRYASLGQEKLAYANYRVAVGLLVGQGWEQRRPTLPKLYVSKARPKVLAFLRLNYLFGGKPMAKNKVIHQWYLPSYPSIDWTIAAVNVKRPRPSALLCYSICKKG